ncbi:hypothetical protein [Novosphingobium sp.]|uniref:hypothetical protein n=1 Tax=Novosphingobium sp. TaxID=1874826 RepID=UPI0025DA3E45|nr:hypothetical protein [Novosphingobium sp.]
MASTLSGSPADCVQSDAAAERAPNPRRHYSGPEDLMDDVELDRGAREQLLLQWKDEVNAELAAEAEGMSASDPIRAEAEARLASEARRVSDALAALQAERSSI